MSAPFMLPVEDDPFNFAKYGVRVGAAERRSVG
jgi:hypothetical protein